MKLLTYRAADQDGYIGGYVAANGNCRAWGETEAEALRKLAAKVMPGDWRVIKKESK